MCNMVYMHIIICILYKSINYRIKKGRMCLSQLISNILLSKSYKMCLNPSWKFILIFDNIWILRIFLINTWVLCFSENCDYLFLNLRGRHLLEIDSWFAWEMPPAKEVLYEPVGGRGEDGDWESWPLALCSRTSVWVLCSRIEKLKTLFKRHSGATEPKVTACGRSFSLLWLPLWWW